LATLRTRDLRATVYLGLFTVRKGRCAPRPPPSFAAMLLLSLSYVIFSLSMKLPPGENNVIKKSDKNHTLGKIGKPITKALVKGFPCVY
jgi:hypothetical protein